MKPGGQPWAAPAGVIVAVAGVSFAANLVDAMAATAVRLVAGMVAVGAAAYGSQHHGARSRGAWLLIAVGIGAWVVGDTLWDAFDAANFAPTSGWYDVVNVVYLTMYPVIFVGLFKIAAPSRQLHSVDSVVDSAVLFLSGVLLLQVFVIHPRFAAQSTLDWFATVYPYGDAMLLAAIGWLAFTHAQRNAAMWLLGAGLAMLIGVDVAWEMTQQYSIRGWDQWINPLYPLSYAVIAAAALHPGAAHVGDRDLQPSRLHPMRLAFLCTALAVVPISAFLGARSDVLVEIMTSALVAAIAVRLTVLMRAVENGRSRFANLAAAVPVGIVEADHSLTITFANESVGRFAGSDPVGMDARQLMTVVDERDQQVLAQAFAHVLAGNASSVELRIRDAEGTLRWIAWSGVPEQSSSGHVTGVIVSATDITAIKEAAEIQELQATHDTLTGLPNRRLLFDRLQTAIMRLNRQPGLLAVLFLDLDGFKPVNDRYGHEAGDEVLKVVADRMRASVRADDTLARLGGDEFVIILERVTDMANAARVAQKIISAVSVPIQVSAGRGALAPTVEVSACVGIATSDDPRTTPDALVRDADAAMYQAKKDGRGQIRLAGRSSSDLEGRTRLTCQS